MEGETNYVERLEINRRFEAKHGKHSLLIHCIAKLLNVAVSFKGCGTKLSSTAMNNIFCFFLLFSILADSK